MGDLTIKQEKFCQKYLETGNAAEAYRLSYDAENMKPVTIRRKAAELLENGNVTARVHALQAAHLKRHEVTVDSISEELEESRRLATADRQHTAAINATLGKAKLFGLLSDKVTIERKLEDLSDDELAALARSKGLIDREAEDSSGTGKAET